MSYIPSVLSPSIDFVINVLIHYCLKYFIPSIIFLKRTKSVFVIIFDDEGNKYKGATNCPSSVPFFLALKAAEDVQASLLYV